MADISFLHYIQPSELQGMFDEARLRLLIDKLDRIRTTCIGKEDRCKREFRDFLNQSGAAPDVINAVDNLFTLAILTDMNQQQKLQRGEMGLRDADAWSTTPLHNPNRVITQENRDVTREDLQPIADATDDDTLITAITTFYDKNFEFASNPTHQDIQNMLQAMEQSQHLLRLIQVASDAQQSFIVQARSGAGDFERLREASNQKITESLSELLIQWTSDRKNEIYGTTSPTTQRATQTHSNTLPLPLTDDKKWNEIDNLFPSSIFVQDPLLDKKYINELQDHFEKLLGRKKMFRWKPVPPPEFGGFLARVRGGNLKIKEIIYQRYIQAYKEVMDIINE
tara:strand:- start:1449 stop:2465 length:1017 start_codon:yes stop_codon:yes gene_type:complete